MPQTDITSCRGLIVQFNPLQAPDGYLIKADDAVCRRENTFENRRGYRLYSTIASEPDQAMSYLDRVLLQYSNKVAYDSNGAGLFNDYTGTYSPPAGRKMRFQDANSNLYITTTNGVRVLMDIAGTAARLAGAPRALDPSYTLTGASGFLADGRQIAYRVVIQRIDQNDNILNGYPSQRMWVTNTSGGSRNVAITIYFPADAIAGDIIQVYRTQSKPYTAGDADEADDEMNLVYQYTLTAADITAGFITFTDILVESLAAANDPLYTNPSQETISQANARPPLAKDIALYKSTTMFYANTQSLEQLYFTLVSAVGLSGNTITLAGTTYTFAATENTAIGQVQVFSTGVVANDIDSTARSLVRVINRYATNTTVYAYYISGGNDLPGQILIEERVVGGAPFTLTVGSPTISANFFPAPATTPTTASTSSNSVQKNALYFSKLQELEAVPLVNFIPIGPSNTNILRIKALRDSLIIIKEEGIYRLVGETGQNFSVSPIDLTVFCKAIESVDALNNQVFMLSNQGVVAISDTGVTVVSREIEPKILPLLTYTTAIQSTFGFAYNSERSYFLALPQTSGETATSQTFVFNVFTKAWTRWTFGMGTGIVEPTADFMYFTVSGQAAIYKERKSFTYADYADPEYSVTITASSISGNDIQVTSSVLPVKDWAITFLGTNLKIVSVDASAAPVYTLTLQYPPPPTWNAGGAATLWPGIQMTVEWGNWTAGQSGVMKQERELKILTDNIPGNGNISSLYATFRTDLDANPDIVEITNSAAGWGAPWGSFPWGGLPDNYAYPIWVPKNKSYFRILNPGVIHKNALEMFACSGISHTYEMISERTNK